MMKEEREIRSELDRWYDNYIRENANSPTVQKMLEVETRIREALNAVKEV